MPELTQTQIANLRTHPHSLAKHYLYVFVPEDVLVGTVVGDVGKVQAVPYNLTSGDFAEVRRGHTLRVEDSSGNYKGIVRVRQRAGAWNDEGATAANIYVSEHEIDLANGDLLYVKDEFRLWHVNPYIDPTTGAIYKDWNGGTQIGWPGPDLATGLSANENLVYQPVPVMGPHSVEFLEDGVATHAWDWGANSWGIDPNTGILSYSATFPNAATVTPNVTASSGTVTWTQQGAEWVKLDLTDNAAGGAIQAYPGRRLFVTLDRDDLPDNCYVDFQAGPRTGAVDQGGFNMQFTVRVNALESAFPDGALVIWFFDGGIPQDVGGNWPDRSHIHFIGYIRRASTHKEPETGYVTFDATTLEGVMKALPEFPNFLENRAAGAATVWTDAVSLTVQRAAYLQMRWQSTLLEMADVLFVPSATTTIGEHEFPEADLYSQINALVDRDYRYRVGCDPLSTVYVNKDPQFIAPASRTMATIMALEPQDWREAIDFPEPLEPQTGYVLASGNAYSVGALTPLFSQAPGPVPLERGKRDKSLSRLICTAQAALNTLSGLALAQANNDFPEIPVKLDGQYYIGHLFPMEFVTLDVQGTALPEGTKRGMDLSGEKFIPRRSTLQVVEDHALVDLTLEKVTDGLGIEGETLVYPVSVGDDVSGGVKPPDMDEGPEGYFWVPVGPPPSGQIAVAAHSEGGVYWSPDSGQSWGLRRTGKFLDLITDPWWFTASRAGTTDPNYVILWGCGQGFVVRSGQDAGVGTWTNVTPANNPPNWWGDATPPTATSVTYRQVHADIYALNTFYVLVEWQEVDSGNGEWRGWIAKSTDNGVSWGWHTLLFDWSFWKLDEATGAQRNDCISTNHLTNNNNVSQIVGKVGNASHFTRAATQYLSIVSNPSLRMDGNSSFTIACWVYLDSTPASPAFMHVWEKLNEYSLTWEAAVNRFRFKVATAPASHEVYANTFGALAINTWYFVVCWYDAVSAEMGIQVNNGGADTTNTGVDTLTGTASNFYIGRAEAGNYWDGRVDACGFWKRFLSAAERTALWNGGIGQEPPLTGVGYGHTRPLGFDVDNENSTRLYVTRWLDGQLVVQRYNTTTFAIETMHTFALATKAEMEAKTYWILPHSPYVPGAGAGFGNYLWVFGHYNDGADKHATFSIDGAGSFTDYNDVAWGTTHRIGSIIALADGLTVYAILNHAATPRLWRTTDGGANWTNLNALPAGWDGVGFRTFNRFDAYAHGMGGEPDLLLIGSDKAQAMMAAYLVSPYAGTWVDATGSPSLPTALGYISSIFWM